MTTKSIIEDIFDNAGLSHAFDRESFAAEYARNLREGTHDRVRGFTGFGLKPAGSAGWDRGYLAAAQEYEAAVRNKKAA